MWVGKRPGERSRKCSFHRVASRLEEETMERKSDPACHLLSLRSSSEANKVRQGGLASVVFPFGPEWVARWAPHTPQIASTRRVHIGAICRRSCPKPNPRLNKHHRMPTPSLTRTTIARNGVDSTRQFRRGRLREISKAGKGRSDDKLHRSNRPDARTAHLGGVESLS